MSLQVGKVIYNILSGDANIVDRVESKIYPLVADIDTTFPFIVYRRTKVVPAESKDRQTYDKDIYVEIIVASDKYEEGVEIADLVRSTLQKGNYKDIREIRLSDADEEYKEDVFLQNLTFKIRK